MIQKMIRVPVNRMSEDNPLEKKNENTTIHPAATVVLIKDSEQGMKILLVRRSKKLDFVGGAWVFPGGRIDSEDFSPGRSDDMESAARRAAVREVGEETGLRIDSEDLVYFSHWITPEESPKRYDTWFFIAAVNPAAVRVDGSEIREYKWFRPSEALRSQQAGNIQLMPPTFVTLQDLSRFDTAETALEHYRMRPPLRFSPRIVMVNGGVCSLYQGDAGYETRDPERPGLRHRFWMTDRGWHYEKG